MWQTHKFFNIIGILILSYIFRKFSTRLYLFGKCKEEFIRNLEEKKPIIIRLKIIINYFDIPDKFLLTLSKEIQPCAEFSVKLVQHDTAVILCCGCTMLHLA
jgi:hypothetical protein